MKFLENLFLGNIDPHARAVRPGSRADKLRTLITDHLPEIENALPDEHRGVLERIMEAQGELDTVTVLDSFIIGFRLGAAFTYDTFVNTDTPSISVCHTAFSTILLLPGSSKGRLIKLETSSSGNQDWQYFGITFSGTMPISSVSSSRLRNTFASDRNTGSPCSRSAT